MSQRTALNQLFIFGCYCPSLFTEGIDLQYNIPIAFTVLGHNRLGPSNLCSKCQPNDKVLFSS